ncbi:putative Infection structure specific protein [Seiridium unicorne]|uniref:Infection structure specific protein n=1 Tax=Seiridium unicorne TaxID=138068 RepID=A0ABR2VFN8_9PEZI
MMLWKCTGLLLSISAGAWGFNLPPKPADVARDVAPRQTDSTLSQIIRFSDELNLTACLPRVLPLASDLPTLPSGLLNDDLYSQALSQTTLALADVCKFSVTGTDGPEFTSFLPTLYSWYDGHSSQIASFVSDCPSASPWIQTIESYSTCSQVSAAIASNTASETGTASESGVVTFSLETETVISTSASSTTSDGTTSASTTQSPSSSVSQAQAPRETGLEVAAAAVVGFLGAVAAL